MTKSNSFRNCHNIGTRRELWVDDLLLANKSESIRFELHNPIRREIIITTDKSWEGSLCNFITVLHDPLIGKHRLYYRGGCHFANGHPGCEEPVICLLESANGISWRRASEHGLKSKRHPRGSNIVVDFKPEGPWYGHHGFSPFIDSNPNADPAERYKAIGRNDGGKVTGLFLLVSPDGVNWRLKSETPFFQHGDALDSQNVMFYDNEARQYMVYFRRYFYPDGSPAEMREGNGAIRGIMMASSQDLKNWSQPEWLSYGLADPLTQLYTNNVQPYYRAPYLRLGFPARYVEHTMSKAVELLPELEHRKLRTAHSARLGTAVSDGLFMSSRDGINFNRFDEAFFRPGLRAEGNWAYGDNFPGLGILETDSDQPGSGKELSFYTIDNYWRNSRVMRNTLRIDGFVSLCAPYRGGEIITNPFIFKGNELSLNFSASAAGSMKVEIRDENMRYIPGFELENCVDILGDSLDYRVHWRESGSQIGGLAGRPIRLRVVMKDADWFSWRFV